MQNCGLEMFLVLKADIIVIKIGNVNIVLATLNSFCSLIVLRHIQSLLGFFYQV